MKNRPFILFSMILSGLCEHALNTTLRLLLISATKPTTPPFRFFYHLAIVETATRRVRMDIQYP
jgi:hypothetical protein